MTPEYIIMTSDYQTGADYAEKIGLEINQWQWIRDRFKDPVAYKIYKPVTYENLATKIFVDNVCDSCGAKK